MADIPKNPSECIKVRAVEVQVRSSGNDRKHKDEVADALVEFKKRVKKSGIIQDLQKYEHYRTPSIARRMKREEAQRQKRRDLRKQQWYSKNHNEL